VIFNTLSYFLLFLLPCAVAFRVVHAGIKPWICALFGIVFFVYFSVSELHGWLAAACVFIFVWESLFRQFYRPAHWTCLAGILISVLILFVFKYWNFATGLFTQPFGENPFHWSGIFLPLGVSFFTFEFIHYAADRYKGTVEKGTTGEYAAFIFFFPTMVAGPIKRFQDFAPCLRNPSRNWSLDWNRGITRILAGLVKKFALADLLTSMTDHLNTGDILAAERWVLCLWILAYGWKIYFDFSAYSDIAIGSARLFGIETPENFDWPYIRTNITDFWRHWHISLYRWLVDYVFIPLGGSRGTKPFVLRNLLIVMLVSGIWHGAGANFVVWGMWHGLLLIVHRIWSQRSGATVEKSVPSRLHRLPAWLATYAAVNFGWVFFCMDLDTASVFLWRLFGG